MTSAADLTGDDPPGLATLSEARREQAMARFAVLRPHRDRNLLDGIAVDPGALGEGEGARE